MDVIRAVCDRVAVIEAARLVEVGPVAQVFSQPEHPVTRALIEQINFEVVRTHDEF